MLSKSTKSAQAVGFMVCTLLYTQIAAVAGETPTAQTDTSASSSGMDPLAPVFDVQQWTIVQAAFSRFGKDGPDARVQLLKSIAPAGNDGVGRPLYAVNLIVTQNGRLLYSFAPLTMPPLDQRQTVPGFYMDDRGIEAGCPLELRDVTGDQVPEIIFHSGSAGASDSQTDIHVLQYTHDAQMEFRDVRADHFFESWWWKFRWLDLNGRTVAIVAEPVERSEDPELTCHACPKFHKYRVYRWHQAKSSFVLSETIPSTGKLHRDDEDPLKTDWAYIVAKLKKQ
jgi:hypothetical protein